MYPPIYYYVGMILIGAIFIFIYADIHILFYIYIYHVLYVRMQFSHLADFVCLFF
uniref:Uncharacterized protein n=1 Tax=Anopheles christyi TaxID=43041 RepID=A0A182KI45_9DIPT